MGRFKRTKSKKKKVTGKEYFTFHFNNGSLFLFDPSCHERRGMGISENLLKI